MPCWSSISYSSPRPSSRMTLTCAGACVAGTLVAGAYLSGTLVAGAYLTGTLVACTGRTSSRPPPPPPPPPGCCRPHSFMRASPLRRVCCDSVGPCVYRHRVVAILVACTCEVCVVV